MECGITDQNKIMKLQKCSTVSLCQASVGMTGRNYTQTKQAWQGHNFTVLVSCAVYGKTSEDTRLLVNPYTNTYMQFVNKLQISRVCSFITVPFLKRFI